MAPRYLLIIFLSLSIGACGFKLRGHGQGGETLHPDLRTLRLSTTSGSELATQVKNSLDASDVTVTTALDSSDYTLVLGDEQLNERVVSLDSSARAGEYELSMSTRFHLRHNGNTVLGPETVRQQQIYTADPNNAIAKTEEAERIQEDMRRDLARRIIVQLASFSPAPDDTPEPDEEVDDMTSETEHLNEARTGGD